MQLIKNFINGEFVEGAEGKIFEKRSPLDNKVIARVSEAGKADVDAAVRAAHAARNGVWGGLTTDQRVDLLYGVADEITRRFEDFVAAEMADTGQPNHVMRHVFIPRGAANFKVFADVVKNVPCESFQMATPDGAGALNYAISRLIDETRVHSRMGYADMNAVMGVLESAKAEFYRRVVAPYEDKAIEKNGDIYMDKPAHEPGFNL